MGKMDIDFLRLKYYLESYMEKIDKNVRIEVSIKDSKEDLESSSFKNNTNEINIQPVKFSDENQSLDYTRDFNDGNVIHVQVHGFSQDVVYLFENKREMSFVYYLIDKSVEEYLLQNEIVSLKKRSISSKMLEYADEFLVSLCESMLQGKEIDSESIFVNYLESISNLNYEGESLKSKVLILNEQDIEEHINILVRFENEEYFKEERKIRKILEMSSEKIFVIADFYKVYGLGTIKDFGEADKKNLENRLLIINFNSKLDYSIHKVNFIKNIISSDSTVIQTTQNINWLLTEKILLGFKNNTLYVNDEEFPRYVLNSQVRNIFKPYFHSKKYNESEIDVHVSEIIEIVISASQQKHGTMIVITDPDTASKEIKRLSTQCISIKSFNLTSVDNIINRDILINQITKIDGAIYLDIEGKCHALGVILDGVASNNGISSRGARYNSALRYKNLGDVQNKCVIVVISEDGMIDIVGKELIDSDKEINELILMVSNRKYEDSIEILNSLIKDDMYNPKYYHLRAKCYSELDDIDKAIDDYSSMIELNPPNLNTAFNNRGVAYSRKGQPFDALKDYNEAIKLNPKIATYYSNRAKVLAELNQIEDALKDCDKAISLNKEKEEGYNIKAWIFMKEDSPNEAIEILTEGINNKQNAYKLYYRRGEIYLLKGEKEKALADYEKVAVLKPDYLEVNSRILELKNASS